MGTYETANLATDISRQMHIQFHPGPRVSLWQRAGCRISGRVRGRSGRGSASSSRSGSGWIDASIINIIIVISSSSSSSPSSPSSAAASASVCLLASLLVRWIHSCHTLYIVICYYMCTKLIISVLLVVAMFRYTQLYDGYSHVMCMHLSLSIYIYIYIYTYIYIYIYIHICIHSLLPGSLCGTDEPKAVMRALSMTWPRAIVGVRRCNVP